MALAFLLEDRLFLYYTQRYFSAEICAPFARFLLSYARESKV